MVGLPIPQSRAAETRYRVCGNIDQHIRRRQDSLTLKNKLETNRWGIWSDLYLFGMCAVGIRLACIQCTDTG